MPELPEVETVVRELNKKLKNLTLSKVVVNYGKMVHLGEQIVSNKRQDDNGRVKQFKNLLVGAKVLSVTRRAKLLIFRLESAPTPQPTARQLGGQASLLRSAGEGMLYLLVHLKMTGQFIFEDEKLKKKTGSHYRLLNKKTAPLVQLPGKHTHIFFYFTDGSVLYFNDVRKFGYMKLLVGGEAVKVLAFPEYGPEPLDKKFKLRQFLTAVKNCQKRKISIKMLLMEPSFVAGIGNIYSDEILFHAGVKPDRKVGTLKKLEIEEIYRNIKPVLLTGIKAKGSSVGDFVRTDGSWGKMGKYHYVYGRRGQKCKKCGTMIQSLKLGGRTASFCPKCQG